MGAGPAMQPMASKLRRQLAAASALGEAERAALLERLEAIPSKPTLPRRFSRAEPPPRWGKDRGH